MEIQLDAFNKFYSRFHEFRTNEQYCDVVIQINKTEYPCHKVVLSSASEFFHCMFIGRFKESHKPNVILSEVDCVAFGQILEVLYTGRLTLTNENVYKLFTTSEYLSISSIEEICTNYIVGKFSSIPNPIEVFIFAINTGKKSLIDLFCTHIADNFDTLCKNAKFLEIPFEGLKNILRIRSQRLQSEDLLIYAMICWVKHKHDQRKSLIPELMAVIKFEYVSPSFIKLLTECVMGNKPSTMEVEEKCESDPNVFHAGNSSVKDKVVPNVSPLNVHILFEDRYLKSYAVDKDFQWRFVRDIGKDIRICKSVRIEEYLHSFHYKNNELSHYFSHYTEPDTFIVLQLDDIMRRSTASLIKLEVCYSLRKIFVYYNTSSSANVVTRMSPNNRRLSPNMSQFSCSKEKWYGVRQQKRVLEGSCMVAYDDFVYLLGGYSTFGDNSDGTYVQRYHNHTREWYEMPPSKFPYRNASACVHNGKIYISGGASPNQEVEAFDPRACKWETVAPMNQRRMLHKLVSYRNYLWAIGNVGDLSVEIYDSTCNKWIELTWMSGMESVPYSKVLDAFIFEFTQIQK